jgi:hypothetical protein
MPHPRRDVKSPFVPFEEVEQESLAAWLDFFGIRWFHVPNEGKKAISYHVKIAKQGLKSGVPDCIIIDPPPIFPDHVGAVVELKRVKGGSLSRDQRAWLAEFESRRWKAARCNGATEAIKWLESLGYGKRVK